MGAYHYQPVVYHHPHNQKPSGKNPGYFVSKHACAWLGCGFLSLALLHLLCCAPAATRQAAFSPLRQYINNTYSFVSTVPGGGKSCNYSEGSWVWAPGHGRRYNATGCNVKESHDCIRNGRPDTGYLYWRWQPAAAGCTLPAFDAGSFLAAVRGKHVAFIGDSMARNQAQSLICLLTAAAADFPHRLVYRGTGAYPDKYNYWRYAFPSHGVTVSFYWTPFLVRAEGKSVDDGLRHNYVHLDEPHGRWAADAGTIDVAVLAAGHWFLNGAVYYNGSGEVVGVHNAPPEFANHTLVGYAWPLRAAFRSAIERLLTSGRPRPRTLVLATFSPSHFEGKPAENPTSWVCTKTEPYKEGEKEMAWVVKDTRGIVYDVVDAARARYGDVGSGGGAVRIEVLDVTKLASMRPDGHPGVYMNRDPFANGGVDEQKLVSDCLHFCLPGPVDTFNEILVQLLKRGR
ncbi:hypothetical protein OsI_25553 [Oryza sativa Indica Group]|uniref:Uncharacterized protein n=1 Tax=Oryza sativa subsp. indica TaxID=39946 RepID=A2YK02_ORYSI|nr:hypothetical protein OsI_25553 [Oryza sativa Indica Group]